MHINWKAILNIGESAAVNMIPGAAAVDTAIRQIVAAKTGLDKEVAILQAAISGLQLVESDLGVSFASEPDFQAAVLQANAGVLAMVKAIQAKQQAAPAPAV